MKDAVELLFREVADLPPSERESYFNERHVSPDVRAEVESLLRFDSPAGPSLTKSVADAAEDLLGSGVPVQEGRRCGPYRLVRLLGRGGAGTIFLGERADGEVEQRVAIKFLWHGSDEPASVTASFGSARFSPLSATPESPICSTPATRVMDNPTW